jgi:hypothetical protein
MTLPMTNYDAPYNLTRSEVKELTKRQADEQRHANVWFAMACWVVSGIYLFATTPGVNFFSFQALLFFVAGGLVGGIWFGALTFYAQRALAWVFVYVFKISASRKMAILLYCLGIVLMVVDAVIVYQSAQMWVRAL